VRPGSSAKGTLMTSFRNPCRAARHGGQSEKGRYEVINQENSDSGGTRLLSARQVAERLSISERSVWRLAAAGRLPEPVRLTGKLVRWRSGDIEACIEAMSTRGGAL